MQLRVGETEHMVSAYANDLWFCIKNPRITIPNLLEEFIRYGQIANFHINVPKSKALNLTLEDKTYRTIERSHMFKW